ncbi:hypothetical protein [Streptomyces sp. NRRL WC-3744]|uniref:hypothetical protein n=1 Tax=Streptomyces sp. NRRL WC-3744 TaxID=1463935 RepID=UPI0004C8BCEF|nr:hypothetical protein [Streptomyces sp. NRRL WC-3744]
MLGAGNAERIKALTAVVERLEQMDVLLPGLDVSKAVDLLWFYVGQDAWFSLDGHRHWSLDEAEARLAEAAR